MQLPLPTSDQALPGRDIPVQVSDLHFVNGNRIKPPFEDDIEIADFALGCFWGAERKFWEIENVYSTAVGYMGGFTPNATYEEVCSGSTNHAEVVKLEFDPKKISYEKILQYFFEFHNPTTLNAQGPDIGTQYRSEIFYINEHQMKIAEKIIEEKNKKFSGKVVTKLSKLNNYCKAEDYHQKYLVK